MSRTYLYSISVNRFRAEDAGKVREVFRAYGLEPVTYGTCMEAEDTINLSGGMDEEEFNSEFSDAMWHAVGFCLIRMGSTYVEEHAFHQEFGQTAYDKWAADKETK